MPPVLSFIRDFVWPTICYGCGRWDRGAVCVDCWHHWRSVRQTPEPLPLPGIDAMWLIGAYADPLLATVIQAAKYQFVSSAAVTLGQKLNVTLPADLAATIVPVPLHSQRYRWRGYNQAMLIARELTSPQRPLDTRLVRRIKPTVSQTTLDRSARQANVQSSFAVVRPAPSRVLIVDDVVTTGATVTAIAQQLRQAGTQWIGVAAIAHGS